MSNQVYANESDTYIGQREYVAMNAYWRGDTAKAPIAVNANFRRIGTTCVITIVSTAYQDYTADGALSFIATAPGAVPERYRPSSIALQSDMVIAALQGAAVPPAGAFLRLRIQTDGTLSITTETGADGLAVWGVIPTVGVYTVS